MLSDMQAIAGILAGDTGRFAVLVERYLPYVRGLCASHAYTAHAIDDLVQETFVESYRKLGALRDPDRFPAWLGTIARNKCRMWVRGETRRRKTEASVARDAPHVVDPLSPIARQELCDWVRNEIGALPEKTREAMLLCYVEGLAPMEAARFLGVREAALKKRLQYGRKLVGERLWAELGEKAGDAREDDGLRKRVLAAVPLGVTPLKASAAAGGVSASVGGLLSARGLVCAVAVTSVAVCLAWLQPWGDNEAGTGPGAIRNPAATGLYEATDSWKERPGNPKANAAADAPEGGPAAIPGSEYDHFLYVRVDHKDNGSPTETLVLGKVTRDGFELRDVCTRSQMGLARTVCVNGGKVYGATSHPYTLISIDLRTGEARKIASVPRRLCYRDGRAYVQEKQSDSYVLRVYDCERQAYRDIMAMPRVAGFDQEAISPDHSRLAWFESAPEKSRDGQGIVFYMGRHVLHIADFSTGTVAAVGGPVIKREPPQSSLKGRAPPFAWADSETIVAEFSPAPSDTSLDFVVPMSRRLWAVDTKSGEMTGILDLPGDDRSFVDLETKGPDDRLLVNLTRFGTFRIDVDGRALTEHDSIGGAFRETRDGELRVLYHGKRRVAESYGGNPCYAVSPDGRRIFWSASNRDQHGGLNDGHTDPMTLCYYDSRQRRVRAIAEGSFRSPSPGWRGWLTATDLDEAGAPPTQEEGWMPFDPQPWQEEAKEPRPPDRRQDVNEILAFSLSIDEPAFWLHEPVHVTATLTNLSHSDITVLRPVLFDERTVGVELRHRRGRTEIGWMHAEPRDPEEVVLSAGKTLSVTGTVEVGYEGEYSLEGIFKGLRGALAGQVRGRPKSPPVVFTVQPSTANQRLSEEKFYRLLDRLWAEFEEDPERYTASRTLTAMAAMGPDVGPYIIEVLSAVEDPRLRKLLYRPLTSVACPEAVPFFAGQLTCGDEDERAAAAKGLHVLFTRHSGCGYEEVGKTALARLIQAARYPDIDVRRSVLERLTKIRLPEVRDVFEEALRDGDETICKAAELYVTAYEGLGLADWLARVAAEPTAARYAAARAIIENLESTWHMEEKGALPEGNWRSVSRHAVEMAKFREVVLAWEAWARENPRASGRFLDDVKRGWVPYSGL